MPSLPTPGGDTDVWGSELNNWLLVGHNADGTTIGGSGGGGVTSVNTRTGAVVLKAADVAAGANGTANQVLQTDGSGNGSWVSPKAWPNPNAVFLQPLGGTADDTPQIKTAINNAVAQAISNGTNYAEIWLQPGVYQIKGALVQGGPTFGNAQIPLPVVATGTQEKVVLAIRSFCDGSTLPLWSQTTAQTAGACLLSSGVTGTNDPTYGPACIMGGPNVKQGFADITGTNQWSNMNIVLDGISVSQSLNPTLCGFDFSGIAQMTIGSLGAFIHASTTTVSTTLPTNNWVWGLMPPNQGNNDACTIGSFACEGYFYGLYITEHVVANRVCVVYCVSGLAAFAIGNGHGNEINYASVEQCQHSIQWQGPCFVNIHQLDAEPGPSGSTFQTIDNINDPNNQGTGLVNFNVSGYTGLNFDTFPWPFVTGARYLKIINQNRGAQIITPADTSTINVPASGTALQNPCWRDALIYLSGGSVTNISVNNAGFVHNLPLAYPVTSAQFSCPSGGIITLTYTGTPTWTWQLT